ncbi:Phage head morphogenesis domain [uncultured Caudovirales phage]|uniref:Phage head morphogenesis domain n=1 Tax=uncultured Caudovirales phage TaxID=2100421 RepID=A0A6J5NZB7_9CAUD|nr:Phage head morphogenesis domain [uncultured Caudovirales phage]
MIISSRLASKIGVTQPRQLLKQDEIAIRVDKTVSKAWKELLKILKNPTAPGAQYQIAQILRQMVHNGIVDLYLGLAKIAHSAYKDTSNEIASEVPVALLTVALSRRRTTEAMRKATDSEHNEIQRMLFPALSDRKVQDIVFSPSAGTSWTARMTQLTRLAPPDQVAALVTQWAAQGRPPRDLEAALLPLVNGVRSTARRVARTEGQRVANKVRMEAYSGLEDVIAGYQIHGTMDSRIRPHHAARNGTIYWKDPKPGQPGLRDLPHPPMEADGTVAHNCRCWVTPVLSVDQEIVDDPAAQQLFKNNEGKLIPDPTVYSDWFQTAPQNERAYAVGPKRMAAVVSRLLPGQADDWSNYVNDKTGKLLTAKEIRSETPAKREKRIKNVKAGLALKRKLIRKASKFGFIPAR